MSFLSLPGILSVGSTAPVASTSGSSSPEKSPSSTDLRTADVASKAISQVAAEAGSGGVDSLVGKATQAPVGRTWSQLGQLVGSYATFGLIPAPKAPVLQKAASSVELAVVDTSAQVVKQEEPKPAEIQKAPTTLFGKAASIVKSFFTAIYNLIFGSKA